MKALIVLLLFSFNTFAQNKQSNIIISVEPKFKNSSLDILNSKDKNSKYKFEKVPNFYSTNYDTTLDKNDNLYSEIDDYKNFSRPVVSFGIGPSFIIGFENNYFDYKPSTNTGFNLYLNAGKRVSENFIIKAELNIAHNSYKKNFYYYTYDPYTYETIVISGTKSFGFTKINLLFNGTLGYFDIGKYLVYAFGGIGMGMQTSENEYSYMYENDNNWYFNPFVFYFGIGGGRKISENWALTCDFMCDSHIFTSNQNLCFTPRIGLTFIP